MEGLIESATRGMHAQTAVENQEWLAHGVDDILCVRFDLVEKLLRASSLGDVFHRQQNEIGVQPSRVQQHDPTADNREIMFQDKIVEDGASRHDVFEQGSQRGRSPLPITELVYVAPLGLGGTDWEGFAESIVRRTHGQSRIKDNEEIDST